MKTIEKTMTTQEVANLYYELAEQGQFDRIQDELYADNVTSIEPAHGTWKTVKGIEGVKAKAAEWEAMIEEMHGGYTHKPQVAGNFFTCIMGMDVTMKGQARLKMDEVCVFEVKEGKIVTEQFFY